MLRRGVLGGGMGVDLGVLRIRGQRNLAGKGETDNLSQSHWHACFVISVLILILQPNLMFDRAVISPRLKQKWNSRSSSPRRGGFRV